MTPPAIDRQISKASDNSPALFRLNKLTHTLRDSAETEFRCNYAKDLCRSGEYLNQEDWVTVPQTIPYSVDLLHDNYSRMKEQFHDLLANLNHALGPQSPVEQAIYGSGQWPRITARELLSCLARTSPCRVVVSSSNWQRSFTALAILVVHMQRHRRLLLLAMKNDVSGFFKELNNEGSILQDTKVDPDWLLMQASTH